MPPSAAPHRATAPALPPPPPDGKRYLLVLDKDLPAPGLEPIRNLLARQQQEPGQVVVLSRRCPHVGLSVAMRITSLRMAAAVDGRPGRRRLV